MQPPIRRSGDPAAFSMDVAHRIGRCPARQRPVLRRGDGRVARTVPGLQNRHSRPGDRKNGCSALPPTDYYLDCSHCGAKFIPEKDRFRLVSIARISDPRWRQYLNSCRKPDEWAALVQVRKAPARPAPRIATSRYRMASPKKVKTPLPQPTGPPAGKTCTTGRRCPGLIFHAQGREPCSLPVPQKPSISGPPPSGFYAGSGTISSAMRSAPCSRPSKARHLPR